MRSEESNSYHSAQRSGSKMLVGLADNAPLFNQAFVVLFYIFALYLTVPVIDVPLLGLSLSAPIFFIIAIKCLLKPPKPWFRHYQEWIIIAILIWIGIFMSAMLNGMVSAGVDFNNEGLLSIIRFAYYMLVFVITIYFASQGSILSKLTNILSWGLLVLGLLRLVEALFFGKIGGEARPSILSQNSYGMLFSTFSPFLLIQAISLRGSKRFWAIISLFLVWSTMVINGSRSSWVAAVLGLVLLFIVLMIKRPKQFAGLSFILIFVITLSVLLISALPDVREAILSRASTFQNLNTDKDYETRLLMNQKSIKLFKSSPIIGVGAGRYRIESVALDIPRILSHVSESYFNRLSAHNSYLTFLAENGLLGSIPLAILILTLTIKGLKQAVKYVRIGEYWALAIFISFIQMSIHMWTLSTFTNTMNWFVYGLVGAIIMLGKKNDLHTQSQLLDVSSG